jgi:hypothetical protein
MNDEERYKKALEEIVRFGELKGWHPLSEPYLTARKALNLPELDTKNMPYLPGDPNDSFGYRVKYNPEYGDHRECQCGHSYYRHFDGYEDNAPVGCKYCPCGDFVEKEKA